MRAAPLQQMITGSESGGGFDHLPTTSAAACAAATSLFVCTGGSRVTAVELTSRVTPASAPRQVSGVSALVMTARFGLDPLSAMLSIRQRYGDLTVFTIKEARKVRQYVLAAGAAYNRRVLSDPATFQSIGVMLPGPHGSAQRRIGRGLLGPSGPEHAHYRRTLMAPLRPHVVDQMATNIAAIVDREILAWPQGARTDLFALCKTLVRSAALETLFPRGEDGCSDELKTAAQLIDEHIEMEASPFVRGLPRAWPGTPYGRMLRHAEKVEAALLAWARKEADVTRTDNLMCVLAQSSDVSGAWAGETAILNHLPTLFGAAYETTQTALAWALFLLAQHPAASRTLLDELSALPDDSPERLLECKFLDAVVKESMRLLPSVPTQTRRAVCDAELVDGEVKGGAFVVLSAFLTNRDPDLYGEPDRFKPERWAHIDPNQFEYLAFSAGPRTCIGARFASNVLRIAIGRIMQRYRLKVAPGARIDQKVRLTLRPGRAGIPVTVAAQDGRFEASPIRGNIRKIVRFDA